MKAFRAAGGWGHLGVAGWWTSRSPNVKDSKMWLRLPKSWGLVEEGVEAKDSGARVNDVRIPLLFLPPFLVAGGRAFGPNAELFRGHWLWVIT